MRTTVVLAVGAVVALLLALITKWTVAAIAVVVLAAAGIVVLLRDWRAAPRDRQPAADTSVEESHPLRPDEFSPDISGDPDGPSSDARADHS